MGGGASGEAAEEAEGRVEEIARLQELLARCAELARAPLSMIAIDGPAGSGKSTLAERIRGAVEPSAVVHMDDFYRPLSPEARTAMSVDVKMAQLFDWQRLRAEVLRPLRAGNAVSSRRYDWPNDRLGDEDLVVEPRGLVIVEGVYALREELMTFWDLGVWLDVPREVCLARMVARGENTQEQLDDWYEGERFYRETFRPQERADLVLGLPELEG
jgi:uridine kinase